MAPRVTFANLNDGLQSMGLFDTMFFDVGNLGIIPCLCTGTNALILTPIAGANSPIQLSYANYYQYSFIAANTATGLLTANVAGIGIRNVYLNDGVTQATTGDIVAGQFTQIAFASSLNSGAGGFFLGGGGGGSSVIPGPFVVGDIIVAASTTTLGRLADVAAGSVLTSGGVGVLPVYSKTPTLGASGTLGSVTFGNASSGLVTLQPVTGALGTVTLSLPAATDTLVGKATTDTFTNKTLDTAGTGNSLKINGQSITSVTGTSAQVATVGAFTNATVPRWVAGVLGAGAISDDGTNIVVSGNIQGTTFNKVTITAPASSATLTIANAKTLTVSNSLTLAGTDATTITFQGTDTYVGRATTDTLTNKTFDTAATGNSLSINGVAATANTGTGAVVRATSPTLVTPTIGVATATNINGITISASSGTLTLNTNTLAVAGAGVSFIISGTAGTLSFQGTDTYVGRATTDTLTNKTYDTAGTGNAFKMNGTTVTTASNILDTIGSTQGQILYRNAANWTILAPGSAGQLLSTGGAAANPSWITASGTGTVTSITQGLGMSFSGTPITTTGTINIGSGNRVLLNTLTASGGATLSDTTSFTGTYNLYVLVFEKLVPATNTVTAELQVHSGGTFQSTAYLSTATLTSIGAALASINPTTFIPLSNTTWANTGQGLSGEIFIENPSGTTTPKNVWGSTAFQLSSNNGGRAEVVGWWNSNGAVDGFQVLASSGNLTSGTIKVYGIVN